jgi:actin related protein 2/3 complex subunit 1A/1B
MAWINLQVRVFSAFIKGVDEKPFDSPVYGDKLPFSAVLAEFVCADGAWIHDVAFSPSGDSIGWVSHDSTLHVAKFGKRGRSGQSMVAAATGLEYELTRLKTRFLPFLSLIWIDECRIVAAGHDGAPMLFSLQGSEW